MNNMLKSVISAATLSLCLLTPAHAEEQRYIVSVNGVPY